MTESNRGERPDELGVESGGPVIKDSRIQDPPELSLGEIEAQKNLIDDQYREEAAERRRVAEKFKRSNGELSGTGQVIPAESSEKIMRQMVKLNKEMSGKKKELADAKSFLDKASAWSFLHKADLQKKISALESQIGGLEKKKGEVQIIYSSAREEEKKMMSKKKADLEARGFGKRV